MSDTQPENQTPAPAPRSWRDDALSVFLVASALILGAMYAHDQFQTSRIEDQISRAEAIDANFAVDGANCQVASAGLEGEVVVVSCPGLAPEKVATIAADIDALTGAVGHFSEVVFRSARAQLRCPASAASWPDECAEGVLPSHDHE